MFNLLAPTRPAPLGLTIADVSGGGACPAQFRGHFADGRGFRARYRGGWLSLHLTDDETEIFDAQIGPVYDGALDLAQLMAVAGLSLAPEAAPNLQAFIASERLDTSFRTTYVEFVLKALSGAEVLALLPELQAALSRRRLQPFAMAQDAPRPEPIRHLEAAHLLPYGLQASLPPPTQPEAINGVHVLRLSVQLGRETQPLPQRAEQVLSARYELHLWGGFPRDDVQAEAELAALKAVFEAFSGTTKPPMAP